MMNQNLRRQLRFIDGALTALALAAGETPATPAGITVGKSADGAWEIRLDPVAVDGQDSAQTKKLLQPWRVAPR
jgi:hypothetical protein